MYYKNLTFEELEQLVSKYKNTEELRDSNKELYEFLVSEDIILRFKKLAVDKQLCTYYAHMCKTRSELYERYRKAHKACVKYGWIDEFYPESKREQKLHSPGYWDKKENCAEVCKNFKYRGELKKCNNTVYQALLRNGWLEEFFPETAQAPKHYWEDKEHCREEAKKYKTRSEFKKSAYAAYNSSNKNGWLDEFIPEYEIHRESGYWNNKERCLAEARKCKTRTQFRKFNSSAYHSSVDNNWIDEFFPIKFTSKYININNPYINYTKEQCYTLVKKYNNSKELKRKDIYLYCYIRHKKWFYDFFPNKNSLSYLFEKYPKEENHYYKDTLTKEQCIELVSIYDTLFELYRYDILLYIYLKDNNWLDELLKWRKEFVCPEGYTDFEYCLEVASECLDIAEFKRRFPEVWKYAHDKNWLGKLNLKDYQFDVNHNVRDYVIYEYVDKETKAVYIGLTTKQRAKRRHAEHTWHCSIDMDSVKRYFVSIGKSVPEMKIICRNLTVDEAVIKEGEYVEKYRKEGWFIINRAPTGSIGSKNRCTKRYADEVCLDYTKESSLKEDYPLVYSKALHYGWLDEYDWIERDVTEPNPV